MKHNKILTAVIAWLLAVVLALGVVGCLTTAFSLHLESFERVAVYCAGSTLACTLLFSLKHGWIPVLLAGAALMGYHWQLGEFVPEFWQLVYRISHVYNQAYHWGVIQMVNTPWNAGSADLTMTFLGICFGTAVTWTVCRGKGASLPVCLSLVSLLLCVVVTDTVPAAGWLYLLILGQIMLILTGSVRRENPAQGNRLTLLAALPVTVSLGVLFLAMPKEGYVSHAQTLRESLVTWIQAFSQRETQVIDMELPEKKPVIPENLNLKVLGRRQDSPEEVLSVTAETGGILYLRGQDYDVYDGSFWRSSPNRVEEFRYEGEDLGYVILETRQTLEQVYLPYYPRDGLSLIGGQYQNLRMENRYSFVRRGLPSGWQTLSHSPENTSGAGEQYLLLPQDTKETAQALLKPILEGKTERYEMAAAIAEYVRQAAVYDKNTDPMPEGAGDFALWFLRQGKRGYCVHFATATAVLLRAAGIEARYVSGYMLPTEAGETKTATGENAHAWVEYYEPGLNTWVVLESTPAEGLPAAAQETQGQEETLPAATEEEIPQTEASQETIMPVAKESEEPPEESAPEEPAVKKALPAWVGKLGRSVLLLALAAGILEGQYRLRRILGRWNRRRGSANRMALRRWRETERLSILLRQAPPGELKSLALKAKFSQHTLTEEELERFEEFMARAEETLQGRPWYLRLVYRYVFAVI